MGATIASTIAAACELTAYCRAGCPMGAAVDASALAERFGGGADLHGDAVQRAMRCRRCGARGATWQVTPIEARRAGTGFPKAAS